MKRLCSTLLCMIVLIGVAVMPAEAVDNADALDEVTVEETITVENRVAAGGTTAVPLSSSTVATVTKTKKYTTSGKVIAKIAVTAEFSYNGSSVKVLSKKVSKKEVYSGWSFTQSSFTSSGGTVTLKGSLKKTGVSAVPVSLKITCDKNGNIS